VKRRIVPIIIILFWIISVVALILYFKPFEKNELQQQEVLSEDLANEYLDVLSSLTPEELAELNEQSLEAFILDKLNYEDNKLYGKMKESWAHGKIDCIIEIPEIQFRQCVFTGTQKQIEHDLGIWLAVTAQAGYKLGETRYCIYMHNPSNQSIQISKAQNNLKQNDYIVITKGTDIYLYRIESLTGENRFEAAKKYVENEKIGPEKLYLFTCARDQWQGKSLMINATLYQKFHISNWQENKAKILKEYYQEYGLTVK
jgi:hypothetical protein